MSDNKYWFPKMEEVYEEVQVSEPTTARPTPIWPKVLLYSSLAVLVFGLGTAGQIYLLVYPVWRETRTWMEENPPPASWYRSLASSDERPRDIYEAARQIEARRRVSNYEIGLVHAEQVHKRMIVYCSVSGTFMVLGVLGCLRAAYAMRQQAWRRRYGSLIRR